MLERIISPASICISIILPSIILPVLAALRVALVQTRQRFFKLNIENVIQRFGVSIKQPSRGGKPAVHRLKDIRCFVFHSSDTGMLFRKKCPREGFSGEKVFRGKLFRDKILFLLFNLLDSISGSTIPGP